MIKFPKLAERWNAALRYPTVPGHRLFLIESVTKPAPEQDTGKQPAFTLHGWLEKPFAEPSVADLHISSDLASGLDLETIGSLAKGNWVQVTLGPANTRQPGNFEVTRVRSRNDLSKKIGMEVLEAYPT